MPSERGRKIRTYDGKIAADLPERSLRLSGTGITTVAAAVNRLASIIRRIGTDYDYASKHEKEYAIEKVTRGISYVSEMWTTLVKKGKTSCLIG